MDKFILNEKNNINNEIKSLENLIKRNNETIDRLRASQDKTDFNKKQIEKINENQKVLKNKLDELNIKIEDIVKGKYNDEIKNKLENNANIQKTKHENKLLKTKLEKEIKDEKEKTNRDIDYKNTRHNTTEYNIKKENERFLKDLNSVPEYIRNNLKDMPCNKGYIWKGIQLFGQKPAESKNIILFEKFKGVLKITEINNDYITEFEKNGNNQKKIISKTRIQKIFSTDVINNLKFYL